MKQARLYTDHNLNARIPSGGRGYIAFLLLFFYSSFIIHHSSFPQESGWPLIRNYSPKEYGGEPQVFAIIRDKKTGIMYFGINPGLLSYDGVRWREIPTPNKTGARSLAQGEDGRIYVAVSEDFGYLADGPNGEVKFKSLAASRPDTAVQIGTVWSVKTAKTGVYFQTLENIFRYEAESGKIRAFSADTNGRFVGDFVLGDEYYVRLQKKGLMKIDAAGMSEAPQGGFFKNKIGFKDAPPLEGGAFLIASRTDGLFRYNPKSGNTPSKFAVSDTAYFADNNLYTAVKTAAGGYFLGSTKKGALLLDKQGNALTRFSEEKLLQSSTVWSLYGEPGSPLWMGLGNGVSKAAQNRAWGFLDGRSGMKGAVTAIVRHEGKIYTATDQSFYHIDETGKPVEIGGIPAGQNWALQIHGGKLLAGSSSGIYQVEGGLATLAVNGGHSYLIYPSPKNPGTLYVPDGGQNIFYSLKFENGQWLKSPAWAGVKDNIRGVAEDGAGTVWMGTRNNGMIGVKPGKTDPSQTLQVKYYKEKDGLPAVNSCIPYLFGGKLLAATPKGLYVYVPETDRFEPYCGLGKQFCDGSQGVYRFLETQDGRVYLSPATNRSADIGYLKPDGKGGYEWVYRPFKGLPEMSSIECLYVEEGGKLWIGGTEGLFSYDEKSDDTDYGQAFNCWIREVSATADSSVFFGGGVSGPEDGPGTKKASASVFPYSHDAIKFSFAAPFFDEEQRTLYSYRLEGFDENWSEWGLKTEKEYTNLWEGAYVFKAVVGLEL